MYTGIFLMNGHAAGRIDPPRNVPPYLSRM